MQNRNPCEAQISQELNNQGIQVKAVTQEVDTNSAAGKFQQNLFYMFSQFDNELRKDKTITAMTDLLRKGYWLWTPPVGYINKKKYHKEIGEYAKNRGINILLGFGDLTKNTINSFGKGGLFFKQEEDLKRFLKENVTAKDVILIKGSRGMKMERFINV